MSKRSTTTSILRDPRHANELLLLPIVAAFEREHGALKPGQCLGFTTLPVLGGVYGLENRYAISVVEHARFTGDVHRQVRDLPDGARISIKIVP